ncbi:peptidylprolyl isomerase [Leucobacter sp. 1207-22]|uniref:peptidylprolyl isomerase n=1 Tax=Leucobacter sp. 1207-22 TaxID=2604456 RepID=UPI0040630F25
MLRRIVPATAAAALLVAGLTGCTTANTAEANCKPLLTAGSSSNSVNVQGGLGEALSVSLDYPQADLLTQRTIVNKAKDRSDVIEEGDIATVNMAVIDGGTGQVIYDSQAQSGAGSKQLVSVTEAQASPFSEGIRCAVPGDRVVVTLSAQTATQYGMTMGTPAIAVIDVLGVYGPKAEGRTKGLPNGYPAVVTNENGQPGIVLPPTKAPTGTKSATRIVGEGPVVKDTDIVQVNAMGVNWADQSVFVNTWDSGMTAPLGADQGADPLRAALTGQKVGSQVVVMTDVGGQAQVFIMDIVAAG